MNIQNIPQADHAQPTPARPEPRRVNFAEPAVPETPCFAGGRRAHTELPPSFMAGVRMQFEAFPIYTGLRKLSAGQRDDLSRALARWVHRSGVLEHRIITRSTLVGLGIYTRHKWLTGSQLDNLAEGIQRARRDDQVFDVREYALTIKHCLWQELARPHRGFAEAAGIHLRDAAHANQEA